MQRREKILAIAVAGLFALVAVRWVYGKYAAAVALREERVAKLEGEIAMKKAHAASAERTAKDLAELEERALPTDRELARTLYQNWLLEQVVAAALKDATVTSTRGFTRGEAYYLLPFNVRARGGLKELSRLLYAFYSAPHLHQVRRLGIKPIEGSGDLEISLVVEALALPRADRDDALSTAPSDRLPSFDKAGYGLIAQRNLFAAYQAPRPEPPPSQPVVNSFNDAEHAVVTALLEIQRQPQAWINVRTTGKLLKLGVGDEVHVGEFKGRVTRIGSRGLEFRSEKGSVLVALGDSLAEGRPIAD